MYQDKRRSCRRDICEAPILISDKLDGDYTNALMQNHSHSGMCLLSEQPMNFDTGIYVNILEPGKRGVYRGFFGRVKWCKELREIRHLQEHFGVGINFVIKSHNYFGGIGCMTNCCCDSCGSDIPFNQLVSTDDFVFLCQDCNVRLNEFPEGHLKSSINNYLLGNIL